MNRGQIAADIHRRMVGDERFGYSWEERWGYEAERWTVDGISFNIYVGDYDCSSSVITAWRKALTGTPYEKSLEGATYTGNMREVFVGSGLFEWKPMSFIASPGDLYLDERNHVAMCQSQEPDLMSEFCINEHGGTHGGERGDQTRGESAVNPYREFADGILHYNGKADSGGNPSKKSVLYGIDVSSNQPEAICSMVEHDFAIVKMGGNPQSYDWDYVNPYAKRQAADAVKKHGRVGLYWFTWGKDAYVEADLFVKCVKELGYIGKAVLVIDYEAEAVNLGRAWVKRFADRVKAKAGYAPVIYASGSVIVSQGLMGLGYPIWCANYSLGYDAISGYTTAGCKIYGGCESSVLWQYTSQGYLKGYSGPLDCNVFFGGDADWKKLLGKAAPKPAPKPAARFRVSCDPKGKRWLAYGRYGIRGMAIRFLDAEGFGRYRVFTRKGGWLKWGVKGDGSQIQGVEFEDSSTRYSVRPLGGRSYYPDMLGKKDTGGSGDTFAGDLQNSIDGIRIS